MKILQYNQPGGTHRFKKLLQDLFSLPHSENFNNVFTDYRQLREKIFQPE